MLFVVVPENLESNTLMSQGGISPLQQTGKTEHTEIQVKSICKLQ